MTHAAALVAKAAIVVAAICACAYALGAYLADLVTSMIQGVPR